MILWQRDIGGKGSQQEQNMFQQDKSASKKQLQRINAEHRTETVKNKKSLKKVCVAEIYKCEHSMFSFHVVSHIHWSQGTKAGQLIQISFTFGRH